MNLVGCKIKISYYYDKVLFPLITYFITEFVKNDLDLIYNPKANLNLNYKFNFSALYDNENYFSGIKFEYQNYEFANRNEIELMNSRTQINFFVGYRFKSTKTIKRVFDNIKSVF